MKTMLKTVLVAVSASVQRRRVNRISVYNWLLTGLLVFGFAAESQAVISFTGSSYSQDFNTLVTSGANQTWANDSTLSGWSLFRQNGGNAPVAITTYNAGAGASTTGSFYSFGTGTSTDRALGGLGSGGAYFGSPGSGTVAGWIAVALQNTSGSTLNSFTLSFVGEQWRDGGNTSLATQTMQLQYGFGSTFGSVATWNSPGGLFDYASPIHTATAAAVDGNVAGKVTGLGGTISSLAWLNNDTLWIRWIENNDVGNDHGLAIDDFSISATAIPEASTWYAGICVSLAMLGTVVRKNRK